MSQSTVKIDKYADEYAGVLKKLFHMCQFVINKEVQENEDAIEELSVIASNGPAKYKDLSEVFSWSIKPILEQIRHTFFPSLDESFSQLNMPASKMYPIIQSSILIFSSHLSKFQLAVCKSIKNYQEKIEKYKERYGFPQISKGVVIIDKNLKINFTHNFENNKNNTPIELISVYSNFLVSRLNSVNFDKGISELESVNESIKETIKNFNSIKADMSEIKYLDIPDEINDYILCKVSEHSKDQSLFSNIFDECNKQCDILETGKGYPQTNVKEVNLACNYNLEKMFESLNRDLANLDNICTANRAKSETEAPLKAYLDSIHKLTSDTFSYVNFQDLEIQQKFNKIMSEMNSDLISKDDTVFHLQYLPKLLKEIKILEVYVNNLDKKMNHERSLALYYQHLESIDKSLLKLMTETIMKNDIFIHSFIKFSWVDLFQRCTVSDAFGDFNRKLAAVINPNYLLSIGSINNRITSQFIYNESHSFFENNLFLDKISNEYYNGLSNGLGGIIRSIVIEMLSHIQKFDKSKIQASVDYVNNQLSISKQSMTQNHVACFCTINYQNSPLVLMNYTIDYLVSYVCINYFLDRNNQTAIKLFEHLIDYLHSETYAQLTNLVYSRWISWICVFSGVIESNSWESNLKIKIQNPKLKDIAFKHMKDYIKSPTEININFAVSLVAYESTIDQNKIKEYLKNPGAFPNKHELTTKLANNSQLFRPVFDISSSEKELETKLIILNNFGKLSCVSMHNYSHLMFSPIGIESKELTFIF